jgi:hypothetical protein
MNRIIVTLTLLFLMAALNQLSAQDYKHQAGIRLGSFDQVISTGFSYRYHFDETQAVEAIINLNDRFAFGSMYERFQPLGASSDIRWFYGGGAYVGFRSFDNVGLMGVVGIDYQFPGNIPVNLSADWKPELNLIEYVGFRASTVAVSIRFSFGGKK